MEILNYKLRYKSNSFRKELRELNVKNVIQVKKFYNLVS
jgi:hypothetical protein